MLTTLALASSLWLAAAEAGARADVPKVAKVVVPVEVVADAFSRDMYWVVGSHALDLYTTAWAFHRCESCYELNKLGPTVEARVALKTAGIASTGLTLWKLRRGGHRRAANVLRWSHVLVNVVLAYRNGRHAYLRR